MDTGSGLRDPFPDVHGTGISDDRALPCRVVEALDPAEGASHPPIGRLAKALAFICGPDHPTTVALKAAAESGSESDIKKARTLFLKLKPGDRQAALTMLED